MSLTRVRCQHTPDLIAAACFAAPNSLNPPKSEPLLLALARRCGRPLIDGERHPIEELGVGPADHHTRVLEERRGSVCHSSVQGVPFPCPACGQACRIGVPFVRADLPHKSSGLSSYQKEEKEAAQLARKQSSYKLLDADVDIEEDQVRNGDVTSQPVKVEARRKRFRKKSGTEESEEDETRLQPSALHDNARNVRRHTPVVEDDIELEEAMQRDQEKRAQLERNIRGRDQARTQKFHYQYIVNFP